MLEELYAPLDWSFSGGYGIKIISLKYRYIYKTLHKTLLE